ncbi:tripartite tricarboxylate transporter TctB family protein [Polymorphum gilvum]|nr:tripartite tricarboxylate transporter TctB family protein [Polymorphum gilvum]
MPRLSRGSLMAGGSALAVGLIALWESTAYPFGTARQIGPAIFPLGLSLLMILAGLAILVEDLRAPATDEPLPRVPLASIAAVAGGPLAFALLVERFGLAPAIVASVVISSLADRSLAPRTVLVLAVGLAVACTLIFVTFLKLPLAPIVW